jgi:short-subunit dehydrogenase
LAFEFSRHGSKVVLAARNFEELKAIEAAIQKQGGAAIAVRCDVSKEEDCRDMVMKAVEKYGRIDVLINNAGISMRALFQDVDLDVLRRLMDVNFWGTVYCSKYTLPYLLHAHGSVVGVISIAGHIGMPARAGYSASKFAMHGFLKTLRVENLKTGLHVLIVSPGFTASNIRMTALTASGKMQGETPRDESKMMSAETVAGKIYRAVVHRRRSLILTLVEGKLTVFFSKWLPGLVERASFRRLAREHDSPLQKAEVNHVAE